MLEIFYNIPFLFLEPPNLKLKRISIPTPSAKTIFFFVITSYFLICAGIIYDIIVEPPSIGSKLIKLSLSSNFIEKIYLKEMRWKLIKKFFLGTIENGHSKPVAFLPYRVNGQYIMEGLASSFLFTIGGN